MKDEQVVVSVTPSIELTLTTTLSQRWLARCPICKDAGRPRTWSAKHPTRTAAEKALRNHLKTHNTEQQTLC